MKKKKTTSLPLCTGDVCKQKLPNWCTCASSRRGTCPSAPWLVIPMVSQNQLSSIGHTDYKLYHNTLLQHGAASKPVNLCAELRSTPALHFCWRPLYTARTSHQPGLHTYIRPTSQHTRQLTYHIQDTTALKNIQQTTELMRKSK